MAEDDAAAAEAPKGAEENETKTEKADDVNEAATEPAAKTAETSTDVNAADAEAATEKKADDAGEKTSAAEGEDPMEEDDKEEEKTTETAEEVTETGRGRRVRKSTQSYQPVEEAKKEVAIPEGKGEKLADIPNIVENFKAITWSDPHLKMLHTLVIGGRGKKKEFKGHLLQFSGLVYTEGKEDDEQEKMKEKMYKLTLPELKTVMDLLDIDRAKITGKEELCQLFVKWLEKPAASGKEKKSPAAKKRKSTGSAKGSAKKTKKSTPAKKVTPAKKSTSAKKEKPAKKATSTKKAAAAKSPAKAKAKDVDFNIPGVDIDKVREKVKNIVDNADREELTVKGVRKILEDWLDTDLSEHKDAVRSIVMEVM